MDGVFITNHLAMLDWLSYNWLIAQLHSPANAFKIVITLIYDSAVTCSKLTG